MPRLCEPCPAIVALFEPGTRPWQTGPCVPRLCEPCPPTGSLSARAVRVTSRRALAGKPPVAPGALLPGGRPGGFGLPAGLATIGGRSYATAWTVRPGMILRVGRGFDEKLNKMWSHEMLDMSTMTIALVLVAIWVLFFGGSFTLPT